VGANNNVSQRRLPRKGECMKQYDPNYKVKTREEAKQIFEETLFLPRTDHLINLDNEDEKFLTPKELSKLYKISITKLAIDRMNNVGFPYVKDKGSSIVRYPLSKVYEHINKNMKITGETK
jgi:hypothetical protein